MTQNIAEALKPLAVDISALRCLDNNPRRGDVDAVARSYERFGQRKPIVAIKDGTVIAGNHQLLAARKLGWSNIAVVFVDDDLRTAQAFALADNRTSDLGDYNEANLQELLHQVAIDPELLFATGYDLSDLEMTDEIADDNNESEIGNSVDDVDSISVVGDVWLLGRHRLVCGDCTQPTVLEKLMLGDKADLVWTDPPYGVSYVGKTKDALTIENDGSDEYESILDGAFDGIMSVCRPGAAVYVAAPAGPAGISFAVKLNNRGLFRQRLVWIKDSLVLGHSDYHYKHEDIYYGFVPGGEGRQGRGGDNWYGDNAQTSVLEFARPKASKIHPTMKPVELITYCLKNSSKQTSIVLDLFGGSGSTLIACELTDRKARLVELDPRYVDAICCRWQELSGQTPINEKTKRPVSFIKDV